jgi:VWFA-related protein
MWKDLMRFLPALVLLTVSTIPLVAQKAASKPDAPATFKTATEFVQIPVIVQKSGKHVSGLTKDDFNLFQDGRSQQLTAFEEIHASRAGLRAEEGVFSNSYSNGAESPPQIVILAIDTVNTPALDQANFREELKKYLADRKPNDPPIGLVELTRSGLRIIHDFTRDPKALLSGIESIKALPSKNNDTSGIIAKTNNEQQQRNEGFADQNPAMDELMSRVLAQEEQMTRFQNATARIDSLLVLQQIAQTFKGIPGRKTLLWAGSGFPFMDVTSISASGQRTLSPDRAGATLDQHAYTWQLLNDANIAVYPIDTRSLTNSAYDVMNPANKYSPTFQQKEVARESESQTTATLQAVAQQTGGKPCISRTDLHNCIREAAEENQDYYMLGYYLDKEHSAPGWHKIQLKLNQKATLRYREGFIVSGNKPEITRNTDLSTALNSPFSYTSLRFTGRFKSTNAAGDARDVNFELRIPPDSISLTDSKIDFDILAVVRAPGGKEAGRIAQHIQRSIPAENVAAIQAEGINYSNKLSVPAGEYGVWFVLRDNPSGRTGSVSVPLKVQ